MAARVLAVAGATTMRSPQMPNSTWLVHTPACSSSVKSECTGRSINVASVSGVMNSVAPAVITTRTSAPRRFSSRASVALLYAAMLPVMPRTMRLPERGREGEASSMAVLV